jgi:multiple antibiotic resistance protein
MDFDLKQIATVSLVLFAVIDVLGSIPVLVDLKKKLGSIHATNATLFSGVLMFAFLFIGNSLLKLIGLDVASFSVAGAIIIFIVGMEMTLNRTIFKHYEDDLKGSSIVPIAFPLIAGSGTLTTLLSLRADYHLINIIIGIIINLLLVFLVLKFIPLIEKGLGNSGINILRRVFGIILIAISIKMFTTNLAILFHNAVEF